MRPSQVGDNWLSNRAVISFSIRSVISSSAGEATEIKWPVWVGGSVTWALLGLQGQKWLSVEGGWEQIAEGEVGWGHCAEKGTRSLRSSVEGQW